MELLGSKHMSCSALLMHLKVKKNVCSLHKNRSNPLFMDCRVATPSDINFVFSLSLRSTKNQEFFGSSFGLFGPDELVTVSRSAEQRHCSSRVGGGLLGARLACLGSIQTWLFSLVRWANLKEICTSCGNMLRRENGAFWTICLFGDSCTEERFLLWHTFCLEEISIPKESNGKESERFPGQSRKNFYPFKADGIVFWHHSKTAFFSEDNDFGSTLFGGNVFLSLWMKIWKWMERRNLWLSLISVLRGTVSACAYDV